MIECYADTILSTSYTYVYYTSAYIYVFVYIAIETETDLLNLYNNPMRLRLYYSHSPSLHGKKLSQREVTTLRGVYKLQQTPIFYNSHILRFISNVFVNREAYTFIHIAHCCTLMRSLLNTTPLKQLSMTTLHKLKPAPHNFHPAHTLTLSLIPWHSPPEDITAISIHSFLYLFHQFNISSKSI